MNLDQVNDNVVFDWTWSIDIFSMNIVETCHPFHSSFRHILKYLSLSLSCKSHVSTAIILSNLLRTYIQNHKEINSVTIFIYRRGLLLCKDSNISEWVYIIKTGSCRVLKSLHSAKPNIPGLPANQQIAKSLLRKWNHQ